MALATVTVRARQLSNNLKTLIPASETDCIETTNIILATPSVCWAGNDFDRNINSKIVLGGTANTEYSNPILYVDETIAQIAALT